MSSIFNQEVDESKLFTDNQLVTFLRVKYCFKYSTITRTGLCLYFPLFPAFLFLPVFISSPSRVSVQDETGIMWKYKPASCYRTMYQSSSSRKQHVSFSCMLITVISKWSVGPRRYKSISGGSVCSLPNWAVPFHLQHHFILCWAKNFPSITTSQYWRGHSPCKNDVSISKEVTVLSQSHKVKSDVLYDFFHKMQVVMRDSSPVISSPCYGKCGSSCEVL